MKCFALDASGDVVVEGGRIRMASGAELLAQKIRQVLSTNRGEWWLDEKEGIPVRELLRKGPNPAVVRDYVRSAIAQVDAALTMERCDVKVDGRRLLVSFTVSGKSGTAEIGWEVL